MVLGVVHLQENTQRRISKKVILNKFGYKRFSSSEDILTNNHSFDHFCDLDLENSNPIFLLHALMLMHAQAWQRICIESWQWEKPSHAASGGQTCLYQQCSEANQLSYIPALNWPQTCRLCVSLLLFNFLFTNNFFISLLVLLVSK